MCDLAPTIFCTRKWTTTSWYSLPILSYYAHALQYIHILLRTIMRNTKGATVFSKFLFIFKNQKHTLAGTGVPPVNPCVHTWITAKIVKSCHQPLPAATKHSSTLWGSHRPSVEAYSRGGDSQQVDLSALEYTQLSQGIALEVWGPYSPTVFPDGGPVHASGCT